MKIVETLLERDDFVEGEYWHKKTFLSSSEIVAKGDESKTIFYLRKGMARVLGDIEVGENRHMRPGVYDMRSGEVFGELALFGNEPRTASVIALENCDVVLIDGDKLNEFMENNKDLGFELMRELMQLMVNRLSLANQKMFSLLAWGLKAYHIEEHLS